MQTHKTASQTLVKSQIAYGVIRDLILSGKKLPGTRLVLVELEEELGIGRSPIREALLRLDRSGLVRNVPHKGMIVAPPPTLREVHHIFDLRVELESLLAVEAMHNAIAADFIELDRILERMKDYSFTEFVSLDRQFHTCIYAISQLPHLCLMVEKVLESVETYLRMYHPDHRTCVESLVDHYAMLDAMRKKDEQLLVKTLTKNLKRGIDTIAEGYASDQRMKLFS